MPRCDWEFDTKGRRERIRPGIFGSISCDSSWPKPMIIEPDWDCQFSFECGLKLLGKALYQLARYRGPYHEIALLDCKARSEWRKCEYEWIIDRIKKLLNAIEIRDREEERERIKDATPSSVHASQIHGGIV